MPKLNMIKRACGKKNIFSFIYNFYKAGYDLYYYIALYLILIERSEVKYIHLTTSRVRAIN